MIVTLFKNQKYLFAIIFGGLLIISIGWYFLIQKDLSIENEKYRKEKRSLSKKINKFKSMESQINRLESDWHEINDEFEMVLEKIPDKRLYEEVTDFFYSMIINQGLKIKNFSPSSAAIDKKDIRLPESGIDIMIEKFPIDISLNGSFIDFGQLIESMATSRYRLTASNIEINQKQNSSIQSIKFISYAYFQSQTSEPVAKTNRKTIKKRSTKEARKAETAENKKDIAAVVDDKIKKVPDENTEGVPEMWLEPATEPINETKEDRTSFSKRESDGDSKIVSNTEPEEKNPSSNKTVPTPEKKYQENIVILDSRVCKKVKNNQPLYPGRRFPSDIGRIYCHSLLNNNTGKHNDIYHIWYMNGNLKAKVRIRVRNGEEIPAISNRKVENSDKGTWKIEITDGNKKILDTVIFEVV